MSNLYTVVDEGPNEVPRDQVVSFYTDSAEAMVTATDPDRVPAGTVYQLVEPGAAPPPFLEPFPMSPQVSRLEAARLAVEHHKDEGCDDDVLVGTASALSAFITDGTVPEVIEAETPEFIDPFTALARLGKSLGPKPVVEIYRPHDERIEVLVNGQVVGSANHDEHGWDGMGAVESTALAVAKACGATVRKDGEA